MQVLELGSYVSVAYAGMLLAEQGHQVEKWVSPTRPDPIQGLRRGAALWDWINEDKAVVQRNAVAVSDVPAGTYDVVLDNVRRETWRRWGLDPEAEAQRLNVAWISLRDELDGRSFDVVAQARAWMDHAGYVPFYVGDTAAGLWLAFKACNATVRNGPASSRRGSAADPGSGWASCGSRRPCRVAPFGSMRGPAGVNLVEHRVPDARGGCCCPGSTPAPPESRHLRSAPQPRLCSAGPAHCIPGKGAGSVR